MLTMADLDRIERESESQGPDIDQVKELVKMARRYAEMHEAVQDAIQLMGPTTPTCCGCDYEWSEALAILRGAINSQRKEGGEG